MDWSVPKFSPRLLSEAVVLRETAGDGSPFTLLSEGFAWPLDADTAVSTKQWHDTLLFLLSTKMLQSEVIQQFFLSLTINL